MPRFENFLLTAPVVLLLTAGSPAPAGAASAAGEFAVRGLGSDKCVNFVRAADQRLPSVAEFRGWVDGYLTAVNRYRSDTFDLAPWHSSALLLSLIRAHCEQNPDDPLFEVVHQLRLLLDEDRLVARSETLTIGEGETRLRIYREVLKRVQQALIDRKLLTGAADGTYGPKTKAALETFQKQAGIPVSGVPDQQTLFELLLKPRLKG